MTVTQITWADWSLKLDTVFGDGSGIGNVAQGIADIEQCLVIIFTTPLGSDPLRPTFGADLWKYIDRPINRSLPAIVREVTDAITWWEPRIQLISVAAAVVIDGGSQSGAKLVLTINWQLKLGGAITQSTVTIGKNAAIPLAA